MDLEHTTLAQEEVEIKLSCLERADGSATFKYNGGIVMAAVHGPAPVKTKHEKVDMATLQVHVESLNTAPSLVQNSLALQLQGILEQVVITAMHPRSLITIAIQPIKVNVNGDIFVLAFNAAIVALMDAGISLNCVPVAVNVGGIQVVYSFTTTKGTSVLYTNTSTNTSTNNSSSNSSSSSSSTEDHANHIYKCIQDTIHIYYTTPIST